MIYLVGLAGAFLGAKIVYLAAEGWIYWHASERLIIWATGKSVLGALLGGYVSVEIAKKCLGYTRATGDWFAMLVPMGIIIGRFGCLLHGCCLGVVCSPSWYAMYDRFGVSRWPAVPVEIGFNLLMIGVFFVLRHTHRLTGQHFHIYLIAYGSFRFFHEFLRDTPHLLGPLSGYQIASLFVVVLGIIGYKRRVRCQQFSASLLESETDGKWVGPSI